MSEAAMGTELGHDPRPEGVALMSPPMETSEQIEVLERAYRLFNDQQVDEL